MDDPIVISLAVLILLIAFLLLLPSLVLEGTSRGQPNRTH